MSDVFLLGAGFSKAVNPCMPVLSELTECLRSTMEFPSSLPYLNDDLELLLSYLSQPQPWLSEAENLRNRALFLDVARELANILTERTDKARGGDLPEWLECFTRGCHHCQAHLITLNYDTLLERAALKIEASNDKHKFPLNLAHIYPISLTEARRRDSAPFSSEQASTLALYKLHGSVNWFYSGSASYSGETIYYTWLDSWGADGSRGYERESMERVTDKLPLILPPAADKNVYLQHESLRRLWFLAGQAIRRASRLFCLGYSFPTTDLGIRFLLEGNPPEQGKIPLFMVNTDPDATSRCRDLLGGNYDISDEYEGPGCIERLVSDLTTTKPDHVEVRTELDEAPGA